MKKTQMNKKGITLTSLIIYITIIFVVLAIIMRVTTYYTKNMSDIADTSFEQEFEKFNMYMLQETNKSGNGVYKILENKITFADGNIIEFRKEEANETGELYFNEVKICQNVNACIFSTIDDETTGKTRIMVNLTINETTKQQQYIITRWTARLPVAYQEVEYIESTGTQYIDTKCISSSEIGVHVKFAPNSKGVIFGVTETSNSKYYGVNITNNNTFEIYWGTGNNKPFVGKIIRGYINAIDFNYLSSDIFKSNEDTLIDSLSGIGNINEFSDSLSIYLFRLSGNTSQYINARLYEAKITKGQTEIRDFVPCYRKIDGEIGLYDIVNDTFYTNIGSGNFLKGKDVKTEDKQYEMAYMLEKTNKNGLPAEYQEVEYIESTGTQWIDTGVCQTSDLKAILTFKPEIVNKSEYEPVFGQRVTTGSNMFMIWVYGMDNRLAINYGTVDTGGLEKYVNNKSVLRNDGNIWYLNDEKVVEISSSINDMTNINNTLTLFAIRSSSISTRNNNIKVYRLEIYTNETIKRKFIPCYRRYSGEIGLYDLIEKNFYTNQGTGTFIKGPEVD